LKSSVLTDILVFFFICAQKWPIFCMWPNIIKKLSVPYFFGWFVFYFQELTYAKSFVFCGCVAWLFVPRYRVANSITARGPEFIEARHWSRFKFESSLNVMVAQMSGGKRLWWVMRATVSSSSRIHKTWFLLFFFFTYFFH